MDISPTTQPATTPAQSASSGAKASGVLTSDFETFLVMLTTQMQNQDPLEPMKSDQLSVQLATFSGVEQQVRTNDLLQSMAGQLGLGGISQTAGWVGMEARSPAQVTFDGTPIEAHFTSRAIDDQVDAVVRTAAGLEIYRTTLPSGAENFVWDGSGRHQSQLPGTTYTLTVERYANGEITGTDTAETYAKVREVRLEGDKNVVVLANGQEVDATEITALRQPAA